jgi:hypothetical protein
MHKTPATPHGRWPGPGAFRAQQPRASRRSLDGGRALSCGDCYQGILAALVTVSIVDGTTKNCEQRCSRLILLYKRSTQKSMVFRLQIAAVAKLRKEHPQMRPSACTWACSLLTQAGYSAGQERMQQPWLTDRRRSPDRGERGCLLPGGA